MRGEKGGLPALGGGRSWSGWVGGGVLGGPVLSYQSAADEKALTAAV